MIETLEGDMKADIGDWLLIGIDSELYPCKRSIFLKTYDFVDISKRRTISKGG